VSVYILHHSSRDMNLEDTGRIFGTYDAKNVIASMNAETKMISLSLSLSLSFSLFLINI